MNTAWIAVIAALGASALTGAASLWVTWYREHLRGKATRRDELAAAVTEMLSRSMAVMMRAQAIGQQMRLRSGLIEGFDVTLKIRKPADVQEFHDWLAVDYSPLSAAWSLIWTRGDQETIRLANQLLDACGTILGSATARNPATTLSARLTRLVFGEKQTPELQDDLQQAITGVAHAREQLARHARKVLSLPEAKLFGHETPAAAAPALPDGSHPAITQE
jgi:hypothetical protein